MNEGNRITHWQAVYDTKPDELLSWHQPVPEPSLSIVQRLAPNPLSRILDVGAGNSQLVDFLAAQGYSDLSVLDISESALEKSKARLGKLAESVRFIVGNVLSESSLGPCDLWHDRALLHFMIDESDRRTYAGAAERAVVPGGFLVLMTFAPDGPEQCSGLPVVRLNLNSIEALFGDRFSIVSSERMEHMTPWKSPQAFLVTILMRRDEP